MIAVEVFSAKSVRWAINRLPCAMLGRCPKRIQMGSTGPAGEIFAGSTTLYRATKAHTVLISGRAIRQNP